MRVLRLTIATLAAFATASLAGAQPLPEEEDIDENAAAAYSALVTTPVAAFSPTIAAREAGLAPKRMGFRFQFGHLDDEGDFSHRALAAGIDFPVGTATFGVTAGILDYACDEDPIDDPTIDFDLECKSAMMAGANVSAPLLSSPVGTAGSTFNLSLDGAIGFSSGDVIDLEATDGFETLSFEIRQSAMAAAVGMPLSLVVRSPSLIVVPMLRPGIGFGRISGEVELDGQSEEATESGVRFMLGGGVGFLLPNSGIGFSLGAQKVFYEEGKTVIGLGLTFGR
jgi:hypothetical protein